jgi:hypothetical protein
MKGLQWWAFICHVEKVSNAIITLFVATNNLCRNEETFSPPYVIEVHNCFIAMLDLKLQSIIWFEEVRKHLSLKLSTKMIHHIWRLHTAKLYQWNASKKFMIIDKCWRLRLTIMYNEPVGKNLFGQASSVVFCSCWIIEYTCKQSPHWCGQIHPPNCTSDEHLVPQSQVSNSHTQKSYKMMIFHIYSIKSGNKLVQPKN